MTFMRFLPGLFVALAFLIAAPGAFAEPLKLIAYGDSLIHGYGLDRGEDFPSQLQAALDAKGYEVEVINAGNSGETTAGGLARLDWTLAEPADAMILVLGANDGLRGIDPTDTRANLDAMLAKLDEAEIPVLLGGMLSPRNLGDDYAQDFDPIYPELAQKHGVDLYPFFLEGVATIPEMNQPDGIHPNKEGVGHIVEQMLPQVEELLNGVDKP